MKATHIPVFSAIALMIASVSLGGCNDTAARTTQPTQGETAAPSLQPANSQNQKFPAIDQPNAGKTAGQPPSRIAKDPTPNDLSDLEPEVGEIQEIQQGDLMCYITFKDETGAKRTVGATFELCENSQRFINQRMRLVYGIRSVNDCMSAEPCGKTRRAQLVIQMHPVDSEGRSTNSDSMDLKKR